MRGGVFSCGAWALERGFDSRPTRRRPLANAPIAAALQRERSGRKGYNMCRNIRPLFNFDPPTTVEEMEAAALQYVRKVSGSTHPSQVNRAAFDRAVRDVAAATRTLVDGLVTSTPPRSREEEREKARARAAKRYGARP
jgi:hypothetical protein